MWLQPKITTGSSQSDTKVSEFKDFSGLGLFLRRSLWRETFSRAQDTANRGDCWPVKMNSRIHANKTIPEWLPSGFLISSGSTACPSTRRVLTSFAVYNCIAIAIFLILGNVQVLSYIFSRRPRKVEAWSFWSALGSLVLQILGIILTALLIRRSGYRADIWPLIQLWALRPRATWLIGNLSNVRRHWNYGIGALNHIFVEVFVCGLATVFLGRTLQAAFTHDQRRATDASVRTYWWLIVIASLFMLFSSGMEMLWAIWMVKRFIEQRARPEAQDVDSMRWIARTFVPVTAICSWLIWIVFLQSTKGIYCPGNIKWVDLVWGLVPVAANSLRLFIEYLSANGIIRY